MRNAVLSLLGSSLLAVVGTTAALAADLPSRRAPPVYIPPPIPVFSWTGFYAGVNAGAAFDEHRGSYVFSNVGGPNQIAGSEGTSGVLSLGNGQTAFTGGGQIGYNYQFAPGPSAVVGLEVDAQYLGFHGGGNNYTFTPTTPLSYGLAFASFIPPGNLLPNPTVVGRRTDFFGTVRGRLGYAFDRALVYATGGFAYGDHGSVGYVVGGGLEYAVTANVTLRGEYLYVDLDSGSGGVSTYNLATNVLTLNRGVREDFSVARLGLNYKFDLPTAPVVARY